MGISVSLWHLYLLLKIYTGNTLRKCLIVIAFLLILTDIFPLFQVVVW